MADTHSEAVRSYNMSRIRSKDTKPELMVRKFLFAQGLRYRLYDKNLPGKPDIVLPKYKTLIFIHGCFWHGHDGCRYFVIPKTRTEFWINKIDRNKTRDLENTYRLRLLGWSLIIIYECELKTSKRQETLHRLLSDLKNNLLELENAK